jgi:hypothetical protein
MRKVVVNVVIATDAAESKIAALATATTAEQSEILNVNEFMKKFTKIYKRESFKNVEEQNSAKETKK